MSHWGEIPNRTPKYHAPDVSADIEKAMNKFCLAEFETEYDNIETPSFECVDLNTPDPLILHAIALHKYANDMFEKIRVAELAIESNLIPPKDAVLPIPEKPKIEQKHVANNFNYIPKEFTPFSMGAEVSMPELSESVAKQALIKSTATMFAHIGYETTHQSVLNFMADVLEQFLKTISQKFKSACEDETLEQSFGFPNALERILVEMGLGSCTSLHDYYQTRVIKYIDVLTIRCKELNRHYEKLLIPRLPSPSLEIDNLIRVKVEEEDLVEMDNPEINFAAIEGELGYSSLETGYQLLNSLENEASLQAMMEGGEEEEVIVATPNIVLPEGEVTNITITTKKKRMK